MIKNSIILLLITTIIIFSGCGGNGVSQSITENNNSGTFTVKVNMPGTSEKIIPLNSSFIRVTVEHISGKIVISDFVPLTTSTQVVLGNIPVGINTATIEIFDGLKLNIKAIKKYGFFMSAGQNINPGDIIMGMAIDPNANVVPNTLTVETTANFENIFIENYDDVPHTITVDTFPPQTINLKSVTQPMLPNTPPTFDCKYFTFILDGTYNIYIDGSPNSSGKIIITRPGGGGEEPIPIPSEEPN